MLDKTYGDLPTDIIDLHKGSAFASKIIVELLELLAPNVAANFLMLKELFAKDKTALNTKDMSYLKEQIPELVHSFSLYNMFLNVVEERFFAMNRDSSELLFNTIKELESNGFDRNDILDVLKDIEFYPVFTAHPTESRRRTFLESHHDFSSLLDKILKNPHSKEGQQSYERLMYRLVLLWRTHLVRDKKVEVLFELDNLLYIVESSLLLSALKSCRQISSALKVPLKHSPIRLGSWIGGDRDGNPNVNNDTMLKVMKAQHKSIIRIYIERINRLTRELSCAAELCPPSTRLMQSLHEESQYLPPSLQTLHQNEPFRAKLHIIKQKLQNRLIYVNNRNGIDFVYKNTQELIDDIDILIESLDAISATFLKEFRNLVLLGGFHLLELDFREHRAVLNSALSEIFSLLGYAQGDFCDFSLEKKIQILNQALTYPPINLNILKGKISESTEEFVESFLKIAWAKERISENILESFIVSMTQDAADMLGVLWFAQQSNLWIKGKKATLSITPLLETIDDLKRAGDIMRKLCDNEHYIAYLRDHHRTQEIMIGYSDSSKDGGIFASNYFLNQAIADLVALEDELNIKFKLFHGRGGSISRGGGKLESALFASPQKSVSGLLKTTEQGEVISSKYLNSSSAEFNFTTTICALLKKSVWDKFGTQSSMSLSDYHQELMCKVSQVSQQTYRSLVYGTEGFVEYFKEATPIYFIQQLNIGSRPSKRKETQRVEDLRAIPWVFAWTQNRAIIPAWYGVGSGLESVFGDMDNYVSILHECYDKIPFFKVTVDNIAQSLLKVDLQIASLYNQFVSNRNIQEKIYAYIAEEYEKTLHWIKIIRMEDNIMEHDGILQESILMRKPTIDALNFFQVELIKEFKNAHYEERRQRLIKLINSTVIGIAQGMRNTG